MIVLHSGKIEVWFDPSKLVAFQRDEERQHTHVYTVESNQPATVDETPADIARLKMAWSNRDTAGDTFNGSSIIAITLVGGSVIATYALTGTDTGQ